MFQLEINVDELVCKVVDGVATRLAEMEEKRQPKYLTRKEAAEMLGVSLPSLHNYTVRGLLKKHRINGRVLYDEWEIKEAVTKGLRYSRM